LVFSRAYAISLGRDYSDQRPGGGVWSQLPGCHGERNHRTTCSRALVGTLAFVLAHGSRRDSATSIRSVAAAGCGRHGRPGASLVGLWNDAAVAGLVSTRSAR